MNVSVILYGGGVPLLRSADAAMAAGAAELFVLADPGDPLRRSIADRLRAREVDAALRQRFSADRETPPACACRRRRRVT